MSFSALFAQLQKWLGIASPFDRADDATLEEIRHFLCGYFHQDWGDDAADWESAVDNFIHENPPEFVAKVRAQIDDLLATPMDDRALARSVVTDTTGYSPRLDGSTWRKFLQEIAKRIDDSK